MEEKRRRRRRDSWIGEARSYCGTEKERKRRRCSRRGTQADELVWTVGRVKSESDGRIEVEPCFMEITREKKSRLAYRNGMITWYQMLKEYNYLVDSW